MSPNTNASDLGLLSGDGVRKLDAKVLQKEVIAGTNGTRDIGPAVTNLNMLRVGLLRRAAV
jgi:hypothetical protein